MDFNRRQSFWKLCGPLIIWTLTVIVGLFIKISTFNDRGVWFDIAPSATMWATGILLTICTSDLILLRSVRNQRYIRLENGYQTETTLIFPEEYHFENENRYIYLLFIVLLLWIINLFLSGLAKSLFLQAPSTLALHINELIRLLSLSHFISGSAMCIAIRSLKGATNGN
jgi:hypothetical protein